LDTETQLKYPRFIYSKAIHASDQWIDQKTNKRKKKHIYLQIDPLKENVTS